MAYRKTSKAKKYQAMREEKERRRLDSPSPEYPKELPELRKEILITDYDFKKEVHLFQLYQTGRIDQYRVLVDGEQWKDKIGMAGILAGIRKSMPPVRSML